MDIIIVDVLKQTTTTTKNQEEEGRKISQKTTQEVLCGKLFISK